MLANWWFHGYWWYITIWYFYHSQRRKQKVEDIVGITSKINSLAPPGHYGYDDDQNGSDLSVLGAGGVPTTPKTPAVKRKSFKKNKSQSLASEPNGLMSPPGAKPTKERTSLAPKHKAAKMDVARAMGIMGFNSSRWLDASQVRTNQIPKMIRCSNLYFIRMI